MTPRAVVDNVIVGSKSRSTSASLPCSATVERGLEELLLSVNSLSSLDKLLGVSSSDRVKLPGSNGSSPAASSSSYKVRSRSLALHAIF